VLEGRCQGQPCGYPIYTVRLPISYDWRNSASGDPSAHTSLPTVLRGFRLQQKRLLWSFVFVTTFLRSRLTKRSALQRGVPLAVGPHGARPQLASHPLEPQERYHLNDTRLEHPGLLSECRPLGLQLNESTPHHAESHVPPASKRRDVAARTPQPARDASSDAWNASIPVATPPGVIRLSTRSQSSLRPHLAPFTPYQAREAPRFMLRQPRFISCLCRRMQLIIRLCARHPLAPKRVL
jgi:hypothetical protein